MKQYRIIKRQGLFLVQKKWLMWCREAIPGSVHSSLSLAQHSKMWHESHDNGRPMEVVDNSPSTEVPKKKKIGPYPQIGSPIEGDKGDPIEGDKSDGQTRSALEWGRG